MKKSGKFTLFINIVLTVSILLCFFAGCDLVMDPPEDGTVAADVGKPTERSSEKSTETDEFGNIKLQKEYCTATVDEDFALNKVIVELFSEYEDVEYTIESFADAGCTRLYECWRADDDFIKLFVLTLDKESKENVLEMIKILEQREDVYCAYPSYLFYYDAIPSGYSDNTSDQLAIKKLQLTSAWDINTDI